MYSSSLTPDYLILETLPSNNYERYSIYKPTKDKLYIDKLKV